MGAEPTIQYIIELEGENPTAYVENILFPNMRIDLDSTTIDDIIQQEKDASGATAAAKNLLREIFSERYFQ